MVHVQPSYTFCFQTGVLEVSRHAKSEYVIKIDLWPMVLSIIYFSPKFWGMNCLKLYNFWCTMLMFSYCCVLGCFSSCLSWKCNQNLHRTNAFRDLITKWKVCSWWNVAWNFQLMMHHDESFLYLLFS